MDLHPVGTESARIDGRLRGELRERPLPLEPETTINAQSATRTAATASGRPLRILFLNRAYWPDVEATGHLLGELCTDLARRGHSISVIAGQPNFLDERLPARQTHDGVEIIRVGNRRFQKASFLSRVIGLLSYVILAAWAALWHRRPDVLVVETDPPVLGLLGAVLKVWHRCPMVYYLQDLYPEVGLIMGRLRPGPVTWLLKLATQVGLRSANRVVVLGEDMRRRVLARGINLTKIDIVPNWADADEMRPLPRDESLRKELGGDGRFVVMYAGNLGLSQSLDQTLVAAEKLRNEPVQFIFIGDGASKAKLQAFARDKQLEHVRFLPYHPKERMSAFFSVADVHLVTLHRRLAGCIVPSKLYGILACGGAYIAAVDEDSEVTRITEQHQCGLRIEPDDADALVAAIRWCMNHPEELKSMGANGRRLAETELSRPNSVAGFERALWSARQSAAGRITR
jgi:glycosyltransferase involved in cell wall biosynthesis